MDETLDDFDIPELDDDGGSGAGSAEPSIGDGSAPDPAAGTDPAAQPDPSTGSGSLPPALASQIVREGLKLVPGESTEQAYARLNFHLDRKANAFYRRQQERERERDEALQELRRGLEPIIRDHYRRSQQQFLEQQQAEIPDRDTQPQEYQAWVAEQLLLREQEREQAEIEYRQQQAELAAQAEIQQHLAYYDNAGYEQVQAGLGLLPGTQKDPEFAHAYEVFSQSALSAARAYFPEASPEEIDEFVSKAQLLDVRRAAMNGQDIREVMKMRYTTLVDTLVRQGVVTRAQAREMQQQVAAGAGTSTQPQNRINRPAPQTVAQRTAADSAAAARIGRMTTPATSKAVPANLPPTVDFEDEEAYLDAALDGLLGTAEQRAAAHRRT